MRMKKEEVQALRGEIDVIDEKLCALLKERFVVCRKIKKVKSALGASVEDKERESAVYGRIASFFENNDDKNAASEIYFSIIENCKKIQTDKK